MTAAEHAPHQRVTYADYLKWDDGKRWELIHGVRCERSLSETPKHQIAGVREYWVVNLWDKSVMVYRPDAEGRYGVATVYARNQILETPVLPGLKVELATVLK